VISFIHKGLRQNVLEQPFQLPTLQMEPKLLVSMSAVGKNGSHKVSAKKYLEKNNIYHGYSEDLLKNIEPNSISLSFWSPPYFVGKEYEKDLTFSDWQKMLEVVVRNHFAILKPGGFLVINIADILCFADPSIPRIMSLNPKNRKVKLTREEILKTKEKYPKANRDQLAKILKCSEQTIDRRLNGNNIRGGKYNIQTRVCLVGHFLEKYAYDSNLYLYDKRIWIKDPAWANSRWTSNSLKAVSETEDIYVFWKPGEYVVDRERLKDDEWKAWGMRQIWNIDSVRKNDDHEAKFPFELARRVILLYSDVGSTVLDPFCGSGTTCYAAKTFNRSYIGLEKERRYVDLAKKNIGSFNYQPSLSL